MRHTHNLKTLWWGQFCNNEWFEGYCPCVRTGEMGKQTGGQRHENWIAHWEARREDGHRVRDYGAQERKE